MVLLRTGYLQMYKETDTHAKNIREEMEEPKGYLHSYMTPTGYMLLDWMKHKGCNGKKKNSF
jgi:hypothetical protein